MAASKDLVPFQTQFPAFGENDVLKALDENMSGEKLNQFDLEQIKMPGSGGQAWELLDEDGEMQPVRTFDGIIVSQRMVRTFWRLSPEEAEGNSPPDCSSQDAVIGVGDPGGECDTCPFSQWGSGKNGRGQACNLRRQLFVLRPGMLMPAVLSLPPTSLTPAKQYLLRLANAGKRFRGVVTTFGLEQATGGGFTYSKATLKQARKLEADEIARVDAYALALEPIFAQAPVTPPVREDDEGI